MKKVFRVCTITTAAVGLAATPALADFTDDFTSGSLAAYDLYSPLTPFSAGAIYQFTPAGLQVSAPQSPLEAVTGPGRGGMFISGQTYGNVFLSYTVGGVPAKTSEFVGAFAEVNNPGLGTLGGYAVGVDYSVDRFFISKVVGEQSQGPISPLASSGVLTLNPADVLSVTYVNINGNQAATLTDKTTGTLLAAVSGFDATYSSGEVGLGVALETSAPGVTGTATFGSFNVLTVPEPGTWALGAFGLGAIAFASRRARR